MKALFCMHKNSAMQQWAPLVARVAVGALFLVSGLNILFNISGTAGYYASIGLPAAMLVAIAVLVVKVGGSLMMILGVHAREGALALLIFTILATLIGHTGEGQLIAALKNVGIMGGLLLVMLHGSGPMSLSHKVCPCCKDEQGQPGGAVMHDEDIA